MKVKNDIMEKNFKLKKNDIWGIVFLLLSFLGLIFCFSQGFNTDIWYDEVFSLKFAELSYKEILFATAKDVHPPFYYWYLKTIQGVLHDLLPGMDLFVISKIASMIPFILLYVYGMTFIRKRFGLATAAVFLFFLVSMPQIANYIIEIRMYSLALFLIAAFFIHSIEIIYKNKRRDYLFLFIYGILTAYTQYYACIAIVTIYICLITYSLIEKNKECFKRVLFCIGLSVIFYLPWLPKLVDQIHSVSQNYWILPLTLRSIPGCMKYVFLPVSYDGMINYVLAVIMIAIAAFLFTFIFKNDCNREVRYVIFVGGFVPFMTALTGFVFSAMGKPIFVYRYLIPGLGVFWLVMAILIVQKWRNSWGILLLLPFIFAAYLNMKGFYIEEHKKDVEMIHTKELLQSVPEEAVILTNFNHVQAILATYLENEIYLYGGEPEVLIQELLPNCKGIRTIEESDELKELMIRHKLYFFGSFAAREELLKQWEIEGISYEEEGSFLLERYWFNVYHLHLQDRNTN